MTKLEKALELCKLTSDPMAPIRRVIDMSLGIFESQLDAEGVAEIKSLLTSTFEANVGKIFALSAEVVERHYSEEDLDALLAFHRSAVGQRVTALRAIVEVESHAAGEKFGGDLFSSPAVHAALEEIVARAESRAKP